VAVLIIQDMSRPSNQTPSRHATLAYFIAQRVVKKWSHFIGTFSLFTTSTNAKRTVGYEIRLEERIKVHCIEIIGVAG
jgi:hypothetical protein